MPELIALLYEPATYVSLITLIFLEIVLGVDNIIFIAILAGKLPKQQQQSARAWGLSLAIIGRIGMLLGIAWMAHLTDPILNVGPVHMSGRDMILLAGGLFLIYKSAMEIYEKVELKEEGELNVARETFGAIVGQIIIIDMVFSLDSVITAVGLVDEVPIMIAAVMVGLVVMIIASGKIADILDEHPSLKMLGLSFLLMIGTMLVAEGFHQEIPRGYIYFSLAFSVLVEIFNIKHNTNVKKQSSQPN